LKQVERVGCEAEFILRNRRSFAPFHNLVSCKKTPSSRKLL
jgi:hypothetical protein